MTQPASPPEVRDVSFLSGIHRIDARFHPPLGALRGAAVVAPTLIRLEGAIFLGVSVASGLTVISYVAATAMCVATVRWFSSAPRRAKLITVRDLRKHPE